MKENLPDYLYDFIKSLDMNEEEQKLITEYIDTISKNAKHLYEVISVDDNKKKILENFKKSISGVNKNV